MSLMDIYLQLGGMDAADQEVVAEQVKGAAVEQEAAGETVKMAHDYDAAGRRLARALWGQHKLAGLGFPGKEKGESETEEREEREGKENHPRGNAPPEKGDKGEGKEKKREKEGEGEEQEEMEEKKASILARAAEDPEFAAKLLAWHQGS